MTAPASLVGALAPGTHLHEYRIERVLGHGGFGITYLAEDVNLAKRVAIKEYLPNELAARAADDTVTIRSDDSREAFEWGRTQFGKEARVLARFAHPNLIQVHRFFELNSTAYFVMEYAEGTTLSALLKAERSLPEARLREVLLPIAAGLEQVHANGVLHRDIKPDNIILRADGSPVLIDFGAARQNMGSATLSLMSVVTAGYAPLEQYGTSGTQGAWTDVYALGAVAYRIISGKKPVDAVNRVSQDPVIAASDIAPSRYSPALLAAIDWALEVLPEDRPQSIAEWREALDGHRPVPKRKSRVPIDPVAVERTELIDRSDSRPVPQDEATELLVRKPVEASAPVLKPQLKRFLWPGVAAGAALLAVVVGLALRPSSKPVSPTHATAPVSAPENAEPAAVSPPEIDRTVVKESVEEKKAASLPLPAAAPTSAPRPAAVAPSKPATPTPAPTPAPVVEKPDRQAIAQMAPGATFQDCRECPVMAVLPTGRFEMGSKAKSPGAAAWESPLHTVTLSTPMAIGWFEVTATEWGRCVKAEVCPVAKPGPVRGAATRGPVVNVNWLDALTYTGWLSEFTQRTYRLPTEAEWEYAVRAGTTTSRYWGDDRRGQCEHANGADLSGKKADKTLPAGPEPCNDGFPALAPAGSFAPNAFKLHDMAGNAWEWTLDCWTDSYKGASASGAAADSPGCNRRVIRGGSWRTKPEALRSANRGLSPSDFRGEDLGFRVVAQ